MKGTEKQIKWAEDIKTQTINNIQHVIETLKSTGLKSDAEAVILYEIMVKAVENIFAAIDDAWKIINKRYMFDISTINTEVRRAQTLINRGDLTVEAFARANRVSL